MIKTLSLILLFSEICFAVPSFNQYLCQPTTVWIGTDGSFNQYKCIVPTATVISTSNYFNQYRLQTTSITLSDGTPFNPDPPPVADIVLTGLVARFKLDEISGTAVIDSVSANNGVNVGATVNQAGNGGGIAKSYLNSVSEYVDCGIASITWNAFGTGDFTIGFWVKYSTIYDDEGRASVGNSDYIGSWDGYQFCLIAPTEYPTLTINSNINCVSTMTLTTGVWYYLVATRETGNVSIYINGQFSKTTAGNVSVTTARNVYLFRNRTDTYPRPQPGNYAEFHFYNRHLTDAEILGNFNAKK